MGFQKEVLKPAPAGAQKPQKGQKVTVHCTGYGKNRDLSEKFWSTTDPGQVQRQGMRNLRAPHPPLVLLLLLLLLLLADACATCGNRLGPSSFPAWGIMPDSTLCFEIEVLSIE
ncbi:immunophilin [Ectocarpus siliculosus]|uniref:peptidylprolyl isomerase n=1 Tax=Ectocarpus siliculosus TaxID=2880 RepID=D7FYG9_ECTSI|nr:immunophilin [Ectocarpus siliculosus]|eukprot:CBJ32511.1 immunophilin [Ectocarpus siliculosus]